MTMNVQPFGLIQPVKMFSMAEMNGSLAVEIE
jgi:hypothetical protein